MARGLAHKSHHFWLLSVFLLSFGTGTARADWKIHFNSRAQQAYQRPSSTHGSYPRKDVCEAARRDAVPSTERLWLDNTRCEGFDSSAGGNETSGGGATGQPPPQDSTTWIKNQMQAEADRKKREEERQKQFEKDKAGLLGGMKTGATG